MFNLPFFRYPYYNYYQNYNNYLQNSKKNLTDLSQKLNTCETMQINKKTENNNNELKNSENEKRTRKYNSFGPLNFINPFTNDIQDNEPILEILGLQLYIDDLIILGLIFLLYKENVQDEMLFIALLLLLIT